MINWILRTYQTIQGQCAVKEEGTGTDVGQSRGMWLRATAAGGEMWDSYQALKSEKLLGAENGSERRQGSMMWWVL